MSFEQEFFDTLNLPLSAITLRRIFLLMTRFHFCDVENYGGLKDLMGNLVYTDDAATRTLDVQLLHVFDPNLANPKPAVFVGFQQFDFHKVAVNNFAGMSKDNSQTKFVMPASANLIVRHVAMIGDQAAIMGDASAAFYFGVRPMLMERLDLRAFDIVSVSAPRLTAKAPDRGFFVDLICTLNFNYAMTTNLESHRIKKFAFTVQANPSS